MFSLAFCGVAFGLQELFWKKIERGLRDILVVMVVMILGGSMPLVAYMGGVGFGTLMLIAPLV